MTEPTSVTPETRISLSALKIIAGIVVLFLGLIGGGNAWMASRMVEEQKAGREETKANREAITSLDKTVAVLATEVGTLRDGRDNDGQTIRGHIDSLDAHRGILKPLEARVDALEREAADGRADLRDVDARVRAIENEKK